MLNTIKIVSYNICGLPWWGNLFGDPYDRIDKITDFLIKTDADVICLQEVFDAGLFIILKTKLHNYNYYYPRKGKNVLESGLVIFCKSKIIQKKYEKFVDYCGEDRFCDKGYQTVNIKIKNKVFTIINTHLNADAIFSLYSHCEKTRLNQINQLLSSIGKKIKNDIIFCGDFNIDFTTTIGKNIYKKICNLSTSCINSKNMVTFAEDNIQYDQIFYIPRHNSNYHCTYRVFDKNKKTLSDHFPIQLTLTRH